MNVFVIAAVSADGKVAEKEDQNSLDWTSKEDLQFFVKKTKEAGCLVMGRKTYETIGKPLKGRLNVIMTRDTSGRENIDGELLWTSQGPKEILEDLKNRGFERVAIAGGAQVYDLFLSAGLVTDVFLTVEPVLFGKGTPFVRDVDRIDMELVETQKLGEHAVMLHYKVR